MFRCSAYISHSFTSGTLETAEEVRSGVDLPFTRPDSELPETKQ